MLFFLHLIVFSLNEGIKHIPKFASTRSEDVDGCLLSGRAEESLSAAGCMGAASEFFGQLVDPELFPPKPAPSAKPQPSRSKSPQPKKK